MSADSSNPPTKPLTPSISSAIAQPEIPIVLVDHTKPPSEDELQRAETVNSSPELTKSLTGTISRNITHGSLRQNLAKHRYERSRWQEGRVSKGSNTLPGPASSDGNDSQSSPSGEHTEETEDTWGQGTVERNFGRRVKNLVHKPAKKHKKEHPDANSEVDILYENQRGLFMFGIPRFSSNSLLNFDPSSWVDAQLKPSAVDITNAQVPDPSWEWAWRTWYVDMSRDVDEEGWEYSFWFGRRCAWHGTHPWFHSFVRRRRWLRKRVKRHIRHQPDTTLGDGHALNADYFTIHSEPRPKSIGSSFGTSEPQSPQKKEGGWGAPSWEEDPDSSEVKDIPTLMAGLRRAAIDREKIVLIGRFLDQGGDELHYLAENMSEILSLLVFQSSRQQLLSILLHKIESAEAHRSEHKERGEPEDEAEERYIDNMLKAIHAADDQRKRLEYWSDLRAMARKGEIFGAADPAHGWGHGWEGDDASTPDSKALINEEKDVSKGKGKRKAGTTSETDFVSTAENVPEELAHEEDDDRKIIAAKEEAETRQLAEVRDFEDEEEGATRLTKVTSFSDNGDDEEKNPASKSQSEDEESKSVEKGAKTLTS